MARKSRKNQQTENRQPQSGLLYRTAIYARLSIKDNGIRGDSIENQIEMIENHISRYPDLQVVCTFADNGATGTNFERPAFSEMMEAAKKGTINCIVVKDLSRFGRNYLETGNYLERIFPYLGIRFISVNDHFDSLHAGKNDTLLVPLKSILHDTYAKDLSRKVSSAVDVKKKSGKFMGKIPPYGYVRDKRDRCKLCVHTERAEIIRMIFKWRTEGLGTVSIARRLNDMAVPTQLQIRYVEGHHDGKEHALWHGSSVADILKNPCYIGCMVERKGSNLLYKGRENKVIPESEWNLIENTHEPIIDKGTFEKVQRLMLESRQKREQQTAEKSCRQRTENILRGMVRCGICGSSVQRDAGYFRKDGSLVRYSFCCSDKYLKTKSCSSRAVDETELHNYIFQACRKQLELMADSEQLRNQLQIADAQLQENRQNPAMTAKWMNDFICLKDAKKLTREMCSVMVKKVVLNENSVSIYFTFADEYEKAPAYLNSYGKKCGDAI